MIVVNKNGHQEIAKELLANRYTSHKYTILDMEYVGHIGDRERFSLTIELLNLANFYSRVIRMFEGMGMEKKIDTPILFEAMDHVLRDKPFTDSQLTRYFELDIEFETIVDSMNSLLSEEDHYASYDIDFILLGIKHETIIEAENKDKSGVGDLHEKIGNIKHEMRNGKKTTEEAIKEARKLVQSHFKELIKHEV